MKKELKAFKDFKIGDYISFNTDSSINDIAKVTMITDYSGGIGTVLVNIEYKGNQMLVNDTEIKKVYGISEYPELYV